MEVPGVGAGLTGAGLSSLLRGLAGPGGPAAAKGDLLAALGNATQPGDAVSAFLHQLSEPEVVRFLAIIERPMPAETVARVEALLRASVSAAAEGNAPQAVAKLAELAALDPRRAETLELEPGLAPLRPEVRQLLARLSSAAHLDAESRLGQATQLLEAAGTRQLVGQEIRPEIAILIAGRLLEAGGYANCVRSAEASQLVINAYSFAPTPAPLPLPLDDPRPTAAPPARPSPGFLRQWLPWLRQLWQRAPLLVLLVVWLAIGFGGGSASAIWRSFWPLTWPETLASWGFDAWGVGFLALIGFGFYARVRHWRR
jgi:hypothetical protein